MHSTNLQSLSKSDSYENNSKLFEYLQGVMITAMPKKAEEIKKAIRCQISVAYMFNIHNKLININYSRPKIDWITLRIIIRDSVNFSEKLSALLIFLFPTCLYKTVFRTYCIMSKSYILFEAWYKKRILQVHSRKYEI